MKILKFSAEWCGPCKTQVSVIKSLGTKLTTPIENIDIDEQDELARSYNVRSVPTLILLDETGNEIKRHSGLLKESQLLEFTKV